MPKFKICKTEYFEAIVEAKDSDEAYDIAHNEQDEWINVDTDTTDIQELS
jgi:hypothetical protein